jgi:hypothetical protein
MMSSPGATISGLKRPSIVGPRLENDATLRAERMFPEETEQLAPPLHVVAEEQHGKDMFSNDV